jgi:hypothetical protein
MIVLESLGDFEPRKLERRTDSEQVAQAPLASSLKTRQRLGPLVEGRPQGPRPGPFLGAYTRLT